jgi:anti-anti-sigma factor
VDVSALTVATFQPRKDDGMAVAERAAGDVVIVSVTGDLTGGSGNAALIRDAFRDLLQRGHRKLVLDLAGAASLDSTGLGEIVHAYASTRNRGGTLKLLRPGRRITELLRITKVDSVLDSHDTEAEVLAAFSPGPG